MNFKNIKIATQLQLGFAALLLFVIILGTTSHLHSDKIQKQVETMYNHTLKVRQALGSLEADILSMRLGNRDLLLSKNNTERQAAIQLMEVSATDGIQQLNVLKERYLGPATDVQDACKVFISWKIAREENTKLALSGNIEKVKESVLPTGTVGIYRDKMLASIQKIDDFAVNKADALYASSVALNNSLKNQLILLVVAILLLSLLITYVLLRAVRNPINELTLAANRFHDGDLDARSSNNLKNEFGVLSASFNTLAAGIQANTNLSEKTEEIAGIMLSEDDATQFFQKTLQALSKHTGSQIAAVYLLSDDAKSFVHFESIGLDDNARQSFASKNFEGEFGSALSTRKVQHLKNIPEDTRFTFHTASGKFIPREILTIPIPANNRVIAVISLASLGMYSKEAIQLIDHIFITLCARIEGLLAFRKIRSFSQKLEQQNSELDAQKTELSSQSAELTKQNIELEMQKNQLAEASRLKTNFLSNMSHELRTPLNSVIALSGVLNRRLAKQIPDEEYSYLEVIERNGKHLLNLINEILDISRIESGHEEVDIKTFDSCSLVNEVVSMIEPQAQQKNIELLKAVGDGDGSISSDAEKCRHILLNLISNAVKFTEKGKVEIKVVKNYKHLTITVTDTGIGISEDHLSHIFDEFRQADSSTSRRFGGTGLGLAIAKKYANLLGGSITVKSTIGKGSEFALVLPLRYASKNSITEAETITGFNHSPNKIPNKPIVGQHIKTIILVEDSEPAIIQLKDFLEESGYQILVARDGGEALGIIAQTIPDAMILDLMMPGIDGFEVLKILREAEPTAHIPVLILTAKHITKEELKFLKRNNVHQLIQKGDVNRQDLLSAVVAMVSPDSVEL